MTYSIRCNSRYILCNTDNSFQHHSFVCTQLNVSKYCHIILISTTTLDLSGPDLNGNEGVLHIPQSFRTGASPSDSLVLYLGHSLGVRSYPSAEMQAAYSTVPADWADVIWLSTASLYEFMFNANYSMILK